MRTRANPLAKPAPHTCCPGATTHLRVTAFAGNWAWQVEMGGTKRLIAYCPWCGIALPKTQRPALSLSR